MGTRRGRVNDVEGLSTASVRRDRQDADVLTFVEHLWASSAADGEPLTRSEHGKFWSDLPSWKRACPVHGPWAAAPICQPSHIWWCGSQSREGMDTDRVYSCRLTEVSASYIGSKD